MNRDRLRKLATIVENTLPTTSEDRPGAVLGAFELASRTLRTTSTRINEGKPYSRIIETRLPEETRFWNGPDTRLTAGGRTKQARVLLTTAGLAIWHFAGDEPSGRHQHWKHSKIETVASTILSLETLPEVARKLFAPTDWEVFGEDDARVSAKSPRPYREATPSQVARALRRLADIREPQESSEPRTLARRLWSWT